MKNVYDMYEANDMIELACRVMHCSHKNFTVANSDAEYPMRHLFFMIPERKDNGFRYVSIVDVEKGIVDFDY